LAARETFWQFSTDVEDLERLKRALYAHSDRRLKRRALARIWFCFADLKRMDYLFASCAGLSYGFGVWWHLIKASRLVNGAHRVATFCPLSCK
jgi:hypothetical protein